MKTHYLVFTDLDGTLLDERTYAFEAARPALTRLTRGGHMLVFCTSKTFAECQCLQRRLNVEGPLIVENGGGIYLPGPLLAPLDLAAHASWKKIPLGVPYNDLRRHLREVRSELNVDLKGVGDGGTEFLQAQCGLTQVEAELAIQREFDEPFLMPTEDSVLAARVIHAFTERGLQVSRGGRFHHLSGNSDKGRAIRVLTNLIQAAGSQFETVGLGDSPNDIPMLASVQHPFLVMRPGGFHDPAVLQTPFSFKLVPAEGPAGWNKAILGLLNPPMAGIEAT